MSIRNVLRHRATVKRSQTAMVNGVPTTTWVTVTENLPCLLDVGTVGQPEPTYTSQQQQTLDRSGKLFTLPTSDVKPGDRVTLTAGQYGTFIVGPDPANVSTLRGPSHREFRVSEVPGA